MSPSTLASRLSSPLRQFFRVTQEEGLRPAIARSFRKIRRRLAGSARQDLATVPNRIAAQLEAIERQQAALSAEIQLLSQAMEQLRAAQAESRAKQADSIRNLAALTAQVMMLRPSARSSLGTKLSVIMPVHNRARMAAAAVQSVLSQEDVNLELIVVDDGSDDDLPSALAPHLSHPALRFIRQEHLGVCAARNRGVAESSGEIIVYLDSDNVMYPGYLRALAAAYAGAPDAQCAFSALLWDAGDVVHLRHDVFEWQALYDGEINLDLNCFSHRRRLWDELGGFDETLTKHSDYDLALRYTKAHRPLRIDAIAARYNQRTDYPRISQMQASRPNFTRIRAKHLPAKPGEGLRALLYAYDYPQLSESYVQTELDWFARQGVEIELFNLAEPGAPGVPTVPVHSDDLACVVRAFKPHVIHCHWLTHAGDAVSAVADQFGIPITVRGHGFEFSPEVAADCVNRPALAAVYLFPHLAAAVQPSPKIRPLPACFNSERYYPRHRRNRRLVLRAGACLPTKDLPCFIKVASLCPEYRFVLALARTRSVPDLPGELQALNESLGNPVELKFDVQYDEMAELTAEAGVYLHTFGFVQPFGMPISIAESLACGGLAMLRDCAEARAYAGPHGLYYGTPEHAAAILKDMLGWSDAEWTARSSANADFAYERYADEVVLPAILNDWRALRARGEKGRLTALE